MNPGSRRLIWFAGIYLLSVGIFAVLTLLIRAVLRLISWFKSRTPVCGQNRIRSKLAGSWWFAADNKLEACLRRNAWCCRPPAAGAVFMSASTVIVAIDAQLLERARLISGPRW
jgi:hypothetical protein